MLLVLLQSLLSCWQAHGDIIDKEQRVTGKIKLSFRLDITKQQQQQPIARAAVDRSPSLEQRKLQQRQQSNTSPIIASTRKGTTDLTKLPSITQDTNNTSTTSSIVGPRPIHSSNREQPVIFPPVTARNAIVSDSSIMVSTTEGSSNDSRQAPVHGMLASAATRSRSINGPIQSDVPQIHRPSTINGPIQYSDVPQIHRASTINGPIQYSDTPQIHRPSTMNSDVPQIHRPSKINGPIQYSDTPQIHRAKTINGPIQYSDVPQIHRASKINSPIQYSDVPQIHRAKTINGPIQYSDQASTSQSSYSREGVPHTQLMMDRSFETSMTSSDFLSETSSLVAEDSIRLHQPTASPSKKGVQIDSSPPSTLKPRSPPAAADPTSTPTPSVDRRIEFPFDILVCNISAIDLQQVHFLQKVQPAVKLLCDSFSGATQVTNRCTTRSSYCCHGIISSYRLRVVLYCIVRYDMTCSHNMT